MDMKRVLSLLLALALALGMAACGQATEPGNIYLYGEAHGVEEILDKELELWIDYYHNQGLRHLFKEYSYSAAYYLNQWMQADNDDILDALFRDLTHIAGRSYVKAFFLQIKTQCPETVFHGTDVDHTYQTIGVRLLSELMANGQQDSDLYALVQEGIDQAKHYYASRDDAYRENMMAQNFIREFDSLKGESIMGIYGAAHTGLEAMAFYGDVACMGNQLYQHYGDIVHSEDLSYLALLQDPLRYDTLTVNGKEYQAAYYGALPLAIGDYISREYWKLEDAYEDFKDIAIGAEGLPQNNFPMPIKAGEVFVIDYTLRDGTTERHYHRCDGQSWQGELVAMRFHLP